MNIFEKLTNQFRETLDSSLALAISFKNQEVEVAHLAFSLLSNSNSVLSTALNKLNVDKNALSLELKSLIDTFPKSSNVSKDNLSVSKHLLARIVGL